MIKCQFENGNEASLRHACVAAILLNEQNQILLGKRVETIREGGKYGLIAGFMGRDETITDCLRREAQEESGYTIEIDYLFYIHDACIVPHSDWQNVIFVFVAHVKEKVGEPDWESTELKWFDLDKLPPKEQMAFDHWDRIQLYREHLKHPLPVPFIWSEAFGANSKR